MTGHDDAVSVVQSDDGATAVEYALMVSLIATVIVGAVTLLGSGVAGLFAAMPAGL
jgi:Flp pilus assembly pilin Flp